MMNMFPTTLGWYSFLLQRVLLRQSSSRGPIAHPDAVVLMTPISAHTLTSRSVVFPSGVSLQISPLNAEDTPLVSADGQPAFSSTSGFPVQVSASDQKISLLELEGHSHFKVLRNKLKWG